MSENLEDINLKSIHLKMLLDDLYRGDLASYSEHMKYVLATIPECKNQFIPVHTLADLIKKYLESKPIEEITEEYGFSEDVVRDVVAHHKFMRSKYQIEPEDHLYSRFGI
jgi:small nuclear ribonucleoprotein (snRNP)-like protein